MATNFSANQYENAFVSKRIQNWELPSNYRERPRSIKGSPKVIATDRGHLLPEYRSNNGALSNFVGTWDLPKKLPGNRINVPTARSQEAIKRLQSEQRGSAQKTRRQPKDYSFRSTEGAQAQADTQRGQPGVSCSCNRQQDTVEVNQLNDQPNGYAIVLDEHGQGLSGRMETDQIAAL